LGTGTTDIIDRCVENGLCKPEFHQDEDFRVVLWRPEVQEGGTEGGTETLPVDKKLIRIIQAIRGDTKTAREIMATMQLKGEDNFRKRYLHPSIDFGYVSSLYPDAYKRRDQAYYLTEKGLQLLSELLKE
jgi:predicted HTH transcriptional regulator